MELLAIVIQRDLDHLERIQTALEGGGYRVRAFRRTSDALDHLARTGRRASVVVAEGDPGLAAVQRAAGEEGRPVPLLLTRPRGGPAPPADLTADDVLELPLPTEELLRRADAALGVRRAPATPGPPSTAADEADALSIVLSRAPVVSFGLDREGRFTFSEGKGLEGLGLAPGEVVGRSVFELYAGETEVLDMARRALAGEAVQGRVEVQGRVFDVHYAPQRDAGGAPSGTLGIALDVTAQERLESSVRRMGEAISARTGRDFFRSLVLLLAEALEVDYAFVGAFDEDEPGCANVTLYSRGAVVEDFRYDLEGTPCAGVLAGTPCAYASGVRELFPNDVLLAQMEAESYVGTPLRDSHGRPIGLLGVVHSRALPRADLSRSVLGVFAARAASEMERRAAERALASQVELEKLVRRISENLVSLRPDAIGRGIDKALRLLGEFARVDCVELALFTPGAVPAAAPTVESTRRWRAPGVAVAWWTAGASLVEHPYLRRQLCAGRLVHAPDLESLPTGAEREHATARREGVRALAFVPLRRGQAVVGALGLLSVVRAGALPPETLNLLPIAAEILANAVGNQQQAEVRRALERRLQRQSETVVRLATSGAVEQDALEDVAREIAAAGADTLQVERASVWTFTEDRRQLVCRYLHSTLGPAHEDALDVSRAPIYVGSLEQHRFVDAEDTLHDPRLAELAEGYFRPRGIGATLDATVRVAGRTVGVVCVEHVGGPRAWTGDEKLFAGSLADLVGIGMLAQERRRAQEELAARNRELSSLLGISGISLRSDSLRAVCDAMAEEIGRATGFPMVVIALHNEDQGHLRLEGTAGLAQADLPATVPVEGTLSGLVQRTRMLLVEPDPAQRAEASSDWIAGLEIGVYVGAPLTTGQRVLGTLALAHRDPAAVDGRLPHLVAGLANAVAALIDRRRSAEHEARLEMQLVESQKMEAIGTLAGGVAHDFNNIMTGIMGYTSLLKEDFRPGESVYQAATMIENAAERAGELTQRLLSFAHRDTGQREPVDVHQIVREVAALLRPLQKNVRVVERLEAAHGTVVGDSGQLHQVLLNLAVNARDALPHGGRLEFATQIVELGPETAREEELAPGPYLELTVQDDGMGMPPEVQAHIFEPFFTTKERGKGTGMGLAVVYGIVRGLGGATRVRSEVGRGTTFAMLLPLAEAPVAAEVEAALPVEAPRGSGLVLLVDDEPIVRSTARELLRNLGYSVEVFSSGPEVLDYFRQHHAEVSLVLLDVVMPGMSGRETLRELLRIAPGACVLLSSGWDAEGMSRKGEREGAAGFVKKPYQLSSLASAVAEALADRSLPRA